MQKSNCLPKTRCVLSGGRIAWGQQGAAPVTGSSSHLISQDRQVLCEGFDLIAAKVCRGTLGAVTALSSIKATLIFSILQTNWTTSFLPQAFAYFLSVANDGECFSLRSEDSKREIALLVVPIRSANSF